MSKFNYNEWDFEHYTHEDVGSDDFIYGNYTNWDEFRCAEEDNILVSLEVKLPWGEKLSFHEYNDIINQEVFVQTSLLEEFNLNDLEYECIDPSKSILNILIKFPMHNEELVAAIFDYYEVPSGTDYEQDLPSELQYWKDDYHDEYYENEYVTYLKYPVKFETFVSTIKSIKAKFELNTDELTKKSLILSSCIISESLLKSAIVCNIPEEKELSNFAKKKLDKEIDKQLRGNVNVRNELFKDVFNVKTPKQQWIDLRNALAHDIECPKLKINCIEYTNLKNNEIEILEINGLFDQQILFYKELKEIIDNHESTN
ncbi:hypothetical protein RZE82_02425 [Mollicutes bacterium LVI A0039]|nr:hypothetical protein RZE82_02425 [Mollicutes bacterium LVI A0039]